MEVKDEELKISAKGDASGYGGDGLGKFTGTKDCVSKFARDYLTKMVKKVADEVTVGLGTDYPIMLTYELGNESKLVLVLAPRVSND